MEGIYLYIEIMILEVIIVDDRDYGFGHWSLYPLKPGKKIWMWALSRQGDI